jgi:hypothetical protein
MTLRIASATVVFLALAVGALLPRVAQATPGLDACTGVLHREAGTPTAIIVDAPGTWCLDQDLVESVDAEIFTMISVSADDVTIDCRGHRIRYTGSARYMMGIASSDGGRRTTVRNCHLHGFSLAIVVEEGSLVEDNTVHASRATWSGSSTSISVNGNGIIRRNRIHDALVRAIYAQGSSQVLDNVVDGVHVSPNYDTAVAIELDYVWGAEVRGNVVRGMDALPESSQHVAVRIYGVSEGLPRNVVADNVLVHDGSMGDVGVACFAGNTLVSDNILSGFFSATTGCGELVDNDISP